MALNKLRRELHKYANKEKAKVLAGFFKTGPGQYGEGDIFLGVKVPEIRKIAERYKSLHLDDVGKLLSSAVHEERLLALLLLVLRFNTADSAKQEEVFKFYLKNITNINNWDLVDLTAPHIVGAHLAGKNKKILYVLAKSTNMWERRIAIVSTFYFIRNNQFNATLRIARILLADKEDLLHKAAGWMLREVGKRNKNIESFFLKRYHNIMPRTMLRYAIERFPEAQRQLYLCRKQPRGGRKYGKKEGIAY